MLINKEQCCKARKVTVHTYSRRNFCSLVPMLLPCRKMGEEPGYEVGLLLKGMLNKVFWSGTVGQTRRVIMSLQHTSVTHSNSFPMKLDKETQFPRCFICACDSSPPPPLSRSHPQWSWWGLPSCREMWFIDCSNIPVTIILMRQIRHSKPSQLVNKQLTW